MQKGSVIRRPKASGEEAFKASNEAFVKMVVKELKAGSSGSYTLRVAINSGGVMGTRFITDVKG